MAERTQGERTLSMLQEELAHLEREDLVRLCTHLIQTYVLTGLVGDGASTVSEPDAVAPLRSAPGAPGVSPVPAPTAREAPPADKAGSKGDADRPHASPHPADDPPYNKLEMD